MLASLCKTFFFLTHFLYLVGIYILVLVYSIKKVNMLF